MDPRMVASVDGNASKIVGATYITISLILLSIYISFNAVLLMERDFRTSQAHRLMLFMGILDCIQLLGHLFSGFATIWDVINYRMPHLCRIIGATVNSAFLCLSPLSLVIAIQRLLIVRNIVRPNENFSPAMKMLISLCFVYYFASWTCLLYVGKSIYYPELLSWSYDTDSGSITLSRFDFVISFVCVALTYAIYIVIVISIYKRSVGMTRMHQNERQLLMQASISFILLTSFIFLWHFYYLALPETVWTLFSINVYWILYCGLNPIICVIFSKTIRVSYVRYIRLMASKKHAAASLTVGATHPHTHH